MPKRIPLVAIGVTRDGKTIYPEVGKVFDFTNDEARDLNGLGKATGNPLIRQPQNEDLSVGGGIDDSGNKVDISKLKVEELKAYAAEHDITLSDTDTTKPLILAAIAAAEAEDL